MPDLVLQSDDGTVSIWKMSGLTKTAEIDVDPNPGVDWVVVACGDFDGDGNSDIVFQNGPNIGMWLMDGTSPRTLTENDPAFSSQDPTSLVISVGAGTFVSVINHEGANSDIVVVVDGASTVWTMDAGSINGTETISSLSTDWAAVGA